MSVTSDPTLSNQTSTSRRKIRKTSELICLDRTTYEKSTPKENRLLRSTTKKQSNKILPIIENVTEETVPQRRKILRAKRILGASTIENVAVDGQDTGLQTKRKKLTKQNHVKEESDSLIVIEDSENISPVNKMKEGTDTSDLKKTDSKTEPELKIDTNKCMVTTDAKSSDSKKGRKRWTLPAADSASSVLFPVMTSEHQTDGQNGESSSYDFTLDDVDDDEAKQLSPSLTTNDTKEFTCTLNLNAMPSSSGGVNAARRRTYELEDSVTDISVLKSVSGLVCSHELKSEKDSSDNVIVDSSKVTFRRKYTHLDSGASEELLDDFNVSLVESTLNSTFSLDEDKNKTPDRQLSRRSTSTPKSVNKRCDNLILKQVLMKREQMNALNNSRNTNTSTCSVNKSTNKIKKTKMPNFAAIHQKAADKLEDIGQYQSRKKARAEFLLSGKKPVDVLEKKKVAFTPDTVDAPQNPYFDIALPTTPFPSPFSRRNFTAIEGDRSLIPTRNKQVSARKIVRLETPKTPRHVVKQVPAQKIVRLQTPKRPRHVVKSPPVQNIPNVQPVQNIPNVFNWTKKAPVMGNEVTNRFGFKVSKRDEVKAMVVTKSRLPENRTAKVRNYIKGVRSNRTFDLLMKMRGEKS